MRLLFAFALLVATPLQAREISSAGLETLPPADVVFLGELHDNPHHHENQERALKALQPKAVVFEMLTQEQAGRITAELLPDMGALEEALDWKHSGWPDFAMYYPLLAAAGEGAIYGAQVPRDVARAAVMGGAVAERFGPDADEFGLVNELPEGQQELREAKQFAAHCNALPEDMLPGMVMVQRLRDATLARAVVQAMRDTGGPVAVITGNGHARTDWGAPALLPEGLTSLTVAQLEAQPGDERPFDFWIVTQEAEREDPCKAFEK